MTFDLITENSTFGLSDMMTASTTSLTQSLGNGTMLHGCVASSGITLTIWRPTSKSLMSIKPSMILLKIANVCNVSSWTFLQMLTLTRFSAHWRIVVLRKCCWAKRRHACVIHHVMLLGSAFMPSNSNRVFTLSLAVQSS